MPLAHSPHLIEGVHPFVETGIPGQLVSYLMDPDDETIEDAIREVYTDAAGCWGFHLVPIVPAQIEGLLAVIVGWSSSPADLAAISAAVNTMDGYITAPSTGGVAVPNVRVMPAPGLGAGAFLNGGWIWAPEGTEASKIRTIALRASGAALATGVVLEMIV